MCVKPTILADCRLTQSICKSNLLNKHLLKDMLQDGHYYAISCHLEYRSLWYGSLCSCLAGLQHLRLGSLSNGVNVFIVYVHQSYRLSLGDFAEVYAVAEILY